MQYWIFFIGGVGGDGFSNLLEHADNITPVDGVRMWRIRSKPSDSKVAFKDPSYVTDNRFLRNHSDPDFDLSNIHLRPLYTRLVNSGIKTVIPAHPYRYNFDEKFKYWDFLEKSQHKILLYSDNINRIAEDFYDKNPHFTIGTKEDKKTVLLNGTSPYYTAQDLNYNTFIDIERVWKDWDYLNNILISIGINLNRKYYEEYLDVAKKRPQY